MFNILNIVRIVYYSDSVKAAKYSNYFTGRFQIAEIQVQCCDVSIKDAEQLRKV